MATQPLNDPNQLCRAKVDKTIFPPRGFNYICGAFTNYHELSINYLPLVAFFSLTIYFRVIYCRAPFTGVISFSKCVSFFAGKNLHHIGQTYKGLDSTNLAP